MRLGTTTGAGLTALGASGSLALSTDLSISCKAPQVKKAFITKGSVWPFPFLDPKAQLSFSKSDPFREWNDLLLLLEIGIRWNSNWNYHVSFKQREASRMATPLIKLVCCFNCTFYTTLLVSKLLTLSINLVRAFSILFMVAQWQSRQSSTLLKSLWKMSKLWLSFWTKSFTHSSTSVCYE